MRKRTLLKAQKDLNRELRHKRWLELHLNGTKQLNQSRRKILKLYTQLRVKQHS
jgi:hypothetical protein